MSEQTSTLTPRQIVARAWLEANPNYNRVYYEVNKEALKEKKRVYNEANKEARKENQRAYREANKERKHAWHEANKEAVKELRRAWCEANPEKVQNSYAKRRDAPGEISHGWIVKLLELQRWNCIVCNKDLRYGYHIDHIQPIARGGENTDYNVQALCPKCNLEKSDKDSIEFMQSRGFLL